MDIIDNIFNRLNKERAPHALRAKVLEIPHTRQASGWVKIQNLFSGRLFQIAVPALLVLAIIGGVFYTQYIRVPNVAAAFELTPEAATTAGIAPNSSFILKSSANLSDYQIKSIVKFDPEIDFSVEKAGDKRYRLTPKGNLNQAQIYKVTIAEGPGDHDYSWAYQVKADFQVISTTPGNRSVGAPVATGIEINLNRENLVNPEQFFEITPKVDGTLEQHGTLLLFRPKGPLAAQTLYTVIIKKGLTVKDSTDTLAEDYLFRFETTTTGDYYSGIQFTDSFVDVVQKRPVFSLYAPNLSGKKVTAAIYKFDSPEGFINSYKNSDSWNYTWASFNNQPQPSAMNTLPAKKVAQYDMAIQSKTNSPDFTEVPQDLDNGYYLLESTLDGKHSYIWFQRTPLAHYASYSFEKSLVWLYDFNKKQPIVNGSIQLADGGALGATDGQGLAQFNTPQQFKDNNRQLEDGSYLNLPNIEVVKADGYNPYFIVQTNKLYYYGASIQEGSRYWEHLSTDRPLYQLNDSIQFWGIVKPRDDNKAPEKVTVSLYKGYLGFFGARDLSHPILSTEVSVSDKNTYEGKLDFAGLSADNYTVVTTQGGYVISQQTVTVTTFSKPTYQLQITTNQKAYYIGEKMVYRVKATFYDGTPVPNMALNYAGYFDAPVNGSVTTDKNGEATATVTLAYKQDSPDAPSYWPRGFYMTFTPQKAEEGFISKDSTVTIIGPKVGISSRAAVAQDGTNTFTVTARSNNVEQYNTTDSTSPYSYDFEGSVVAGQKITAAIRKTTYTARQTGEYYDFIEKVNKPTYEYDKNDEIVDTLNGVTGKDGVWKFDRKYSYQPNVYYSILLEASDKDGKIARTNDYYQFSQTAFYYNPGYANPDGLQPRLEGPDADNYDNRVALGDSTTVHLKLNNLALAQDNKVTKIMYYAFQRNILKATTSNSLDYTDTFTQEMSPGVAYKAVVLGPVGFEETDVVRFDLDTKKVKLNVEVKTDKDAYRPGDEVKTAVTVTDSEGKPVSGTVHLSVADQAVFDANGYDYSTSDQTLDDLYKYVLEYPAVSFTQYRNSDTGGGGGGGGPTVQRTDFQDTVVSTSLDLDGSGHANLTFKLPQNLTSWRISAQAFNTKTISAGSSISHISTGLPLFVDASLSTTYVQGDQPEFRIRLFGTNYDTSKPARVIVSAPGLGVTFDQDVNGSSVYVPVPAMPVGQFPVNVTVKQGDLSDAITRTVQVVESNLLVPKISSYELKNDLSGIAGNAQGLTQVTVIDTGRGKQFDPLTRLSYNYGLRLDQRGASYFAQKTLHDIYGISADPGQFDPSVFQKENSGLSLLAYGDADLRTSALITALLPDSVPRQVMTKYFQGTLTDTQADSHRIAQSLFGLAALNQPVLAKLQLIKDDPAFDLEDRLFVANGLALMGDKETARGVYNSQVQSQLLKEGNQAYLKDNDETKQGKLTALAAMLAAQLNDVENRDRLSAYLLNNAPKKDLVVLEQALVSKAALAVAPKEAGSFDYTIKGRQESTIIKNGDRLTLNLLPEELQTLTFKNVKGQLSLFTLYSGKSDTAPNPTLGVQLKREYSVNGKATTIFKDGDLVKVTITATPTGKLNSSDSFAFTDSLPAGLRAITPTYNFTTFDQGSYPDPCTPVYNYPDTIDGVKVNFSLYGFGQYNSCGHSNVNKIIYFARVSGFGSFSASPAIMTSSADPSQYSLSAPVSVKITK